MIVHLCFHGIGRCAREREPGESRYWVERDLFLRILDEAERHGRIQLSFDDGNASDHAIAMPALMDRGLHATFFALAGRLDDPASLGPGELVRLRAAGMSIGTHGWAHVPWRGLSPQEQQVEMVDARSALAEASGGPVDEVALPLGNYDRRVLTQLREHGYRHVYTSDRLPARPGAWIQPRYSVTSGDTLDSVREFIQARWRPSDLGRQMARVLKQVR